MIESVGPYVEVFPMAVSGDRADRAIQQFREFRERQSLDTDGSPHFGLLRLALDRDDVQIITLCGEETPVGTTPAAQDAVRAAVELGANPQMLQVYRAQGTAIMESHAQEVARQRALAAQLRAQLGSTLGDLSMQALVQPQLLGKAAAAMAAVAPPADAAADAPPADAAADAPPAAAVANAGATGSVTSTTGATSAWQGKGKLILGALVGLAALAFLARLVRTGRIQPQIT